MRIRPILFNGEMVRAILNGEKTQTRRMVKYIPAVGEPDSWCHRKDDPEMVRIIGDYRRFCPSGAVGDRLWVRENFCVAENAAFYMADKTAHDIDFLRKHGHCWTPSIHMPRWASRITLEITSVHIEHLADITDAGARAEGFNAPDHMPKSIQDPKGWFHITWNSVYGAGAFEQNPWVWVVNFKRVEAV